jgi:Ser/Thr protein kinase RdoA (MazF antagonist)
MTLTVLEDYNFEADTCSIQSFGSGLINHTWKISGKKGDYILQKINTEVFSKPDLITNNINALAEYLDAHFPDYLFIHLVPTRDGKTMAHHSQNGYYRLWPFVMGSHHYDVVLNSNLAFEAAKQFGKFTRLLSGFPIKTLHLTLPGFHDLALRYRQFEDALVHGDKTRIKEAAGMIESIRSYKTILEQYNLILQNPDFHIRPTHHDTKISNVLFDKNDKGLCVIDLDTVMPGYFISDLGDMIRTYVSPVSEEERNYDLIEIRNDYFAAIVRGFLGEMKDELSKAEIHAIVYAGKFMIYMQAIRFLADHLNKDVYYGAKYPGQNFVRAGNQMTLLDKLTEKEHALDKIVSDINASLI